MDKYSFFKSLDYIFLIHNILKNQSKLLIKHFNKKNNCVGYKN